MPACTLVAQDGEGELFTIGGFSTVDRAREWWANVFGDGGPWKLLGVAHSLSGAHVARKWEAAGLGIAERSRRQAGRPAS